jgi:hypothetical protein
VQAQIDKEPTCFRLFVASQPSPAPSSSLFYRQERTARLATNSNVSATGLAAETDLKVAASCCQFSRICDGRAWAVLLIAARVGMPEAIGDRTEAAGERSITCDV